MHEAQDFRGLIGLPGFSDALITNHITLYEGYVKNVNTLEEKIDALRMADQMATPEYAELKRRFGWEWNGMRLHELYFSNISKEAKPINTESGLYRKLVEDFGSFEVWEKDFRATGVMRGIGWVVLVYYPVSGELMNIWVNEHDGGHLVGCVPLLIMDVFEHAFALDYGIKRADYVDVFCQAIDWKLINLRLEAATENLKQRGCDL